MCTYRVELVCLVSFPQSDELLCTFLFVVIPVCLFPGTHHETQDVGFLQTNSVLFDPWTPCHFCGNKVGGTLYEDMHCKKYPKEVDKAVNETHCYQLHYIVTSIEDYTV